MYALVLSYSTLGMSCQLLMKREKYTVYHKVLDYTNICKRHTKRLIHEIVFHKVTHS